MADGQIYTATTSVIYTDANGRERQINRGMTAREGHPILASHGHLFVPLVPDFEVEEPAPKTARKTAAAGKEPAGPQ